jgi:RNA polymerase sigma-70 factor (ECF subfamily)
MYSLFALENPPPKGRCVPSTPRLRAVENDGPKPDVDALMHATAQGDETAFAALFDAVGPYVFGLARRIIRDPQLAEEVSQEVFVDVWRNARLYDRSRGHAKTWILTIAHRRAVDRVRSEQASRQRNDREARQNSPRNYDHVAETVEQRDEYARVTTALDTLTPVQRQAVELAYYQGYTYREVSELLETPLGTIKARMRDGMIRLRDALEVS